MSDDEAPLFLLWCRECTPVPELDNAMPFTSMAERGRWAAAHRNGTGHDRWLAPDPLSQRTTRPPATIAGRSARGDWIITTLTDGTVAARTHEPYPFTAEQYHAEQDDQWKSLLRDAPDTP